MTRIMPEHQMPYQGIYVDQDEYPEVKPPGHGGGRGPSREDCGTPRDLGIRQVKT